MMVQHLFRLWSICQSNIALITSRSHLTILEPMGLLNDNILMFVNHLLKLQRGQNIAEQQQHLQYFGLSISLSKNQQDTHHTFLLIGSNYYFPSTSLKPLIWPQLSLILPISFLTVLYSFKNAQITLLKQNGVFLRYDGSLFANSKRHTRT